jgi:taurine dioxygenase
VAQPISERDFGQILVALGRHGVLRFPDQKLDMGTLRRFSERFGEIQGPSAGTPEAAQDAYAHVGMLSNLKEGGRYVGLPDAGQDWHTDMSYRDVMGFVNVLYGIRIPRRNGVALGGTEFSNMHMAYEALPADIRMRLADATATHNFEKFWEHMRQDKASTRPPMTDEQRRRRPPVVHPLFLTHPITGKRYFTAIPATRCGSTNFPPAKATRCWNTCSTSNSNRVSATRIPGPRTTCWCGITSARSIARSPTTDRKRSD